MWRLGRVRDTRFGTNVSNEMLLNAAKCQGYSFYRFWIIKEKLGLIEFSWREFTKWSKQIFSILYSTELTWSFQDMCLSSITPKKFIEGVLSVLF